MIVLGKVAVPGAAMDDEELGLVVAALARYRDAERARARRVADPERRARVEAHAARIDALWRRLCDENHRACEEAVRDFAAGRRLSALAAALAAEGG